MKQTWLIQRLNKPYNTSNNLLNKVGEAFSFGGGLKNGGLPDDAIKLLRTIFSFDYMGSAEFEFGAIPETFLYIAKNISNYQAYSVKIKKSEVYVISEKSQKEHILPVLTLLSKNKIPLKGYSLFDAALGLNEYYKKENCKTIGWLELDNYFMFFTDKEAFDKTKL